MDETLLRSSLLEKDHNLNQFKVVEFAQLKFILEFESKLNSTPVTKNKLWKGTKVQGTKWRIQPYSKFFFAKMLQIHVTSGFF